MATKKQQPEQFSNKTTTQIFYEKATSGNPYIAEKTYLHGYDSLELTQSLNYIDTLYLMFRGELPSKQQSQLLNQLMVAFINPGPRHPACRAAMNAAISKTDPAHILPIGLLTLGGSHSGASEVAQAVKFFKNNVDKDSEVIANMALKNYDKNQQNNHIFQGFGSRFNSIDIIPNQLGEYFSVLPGAGKTLIWGNSLANYLKKESMGWLATGVVAAVLSDLGFYPREAAGFYQIICAPGILAQGVEQSFKQPKDMPFIDDENYSFTREKQ